MLDAYYGCKTKPSIKIIRSQNSYRARICNFLSFHLISAIDTIFYCIVLQLTFVRQPESILIHTFEMHETPFVSISYLSFRLRLLLPLLQLSFSFCFFFFFSFHFFDLFVNRLDIATMTMTTAAFSPISQVQEDHL